MKVNGNGEIMLAGILWGTIGIFIWFMKRDGATAEWISFLRVFFSWLILLVFRRLAKRLDLDESIAKNHGLLCLIGPYLSWHL